MGEAMQASVRAAALREFIARVLVAVEMPADDAAIVAQSMTEADLQD